MKVVRASGCRRISVFAMGLLLYSLLVCSSTGAFAFGVLADTCLHHASQWNLGCVPPGDFTVGYFWIHNEGCDSVVILNVTSSDPLFTVEAFPPVVYGSSQIRVRFDSPALGDYSATLAIESQDFHKDLSGCVMTAFSHALPATPDSLGACIDTLDMLDPPYDVPVEIENQGCVLMVVDGAALIFGMDFLITSVPDTILPGEMDAVHCDLSAYAPGHYHDTLYVWAHDDSFSYENVVPLSFPTRQPRVPGSRTNLTAVDSSMVTCPAEGEGPFEQLLRLTLLNPYSCPLDGYWTQLLGWDFDVNGVVGNPGNLSYEILDEYADLNGEVGILVSHAEWPSGCHDPDCCGYTLTVSYGPPIAVLEGTCKSADLDGDYDVDFDDEMILMTRYGSSDFCADFDNSGTVNLPDLAMIQGHSGHECVATGAEANPAGARTYLPFVNPEPNPFASSTEIRFSVPAGRAPVSLRIYDPRGRLVRTLVSHRMGPGVHRALWDGFDDEGRPAASGVYFCRLRVAEKVLTQKLVLLE